MRVARVVLVGAQLVLGATLGVAVFGWRDGDPAVRLTLPLLGVVGLAVSLMLIRRGTGRWFVALVDGWFVAIGLMLGQSLAGARALVDHFDPPPDAIDRLVRFQAWLDPSIQSVVAVTLVVAGTVGVIAALALPRPLDLDAGA